MQHEAFVRNLDIEKPKHESDWKVLAGGGGPPSRKNFWKYHIPGDRCWPWWCPLHHHNIPHSVHFSYTELSLFMTIKSPILPKMGQGCIIFWRWSSLNVTHLMSKCYQMNICFSGCRKTTKRRCELQNSQIGPSRRCFSEVLSLFHHMQCSFGFITSIIVTSKPHNPIQFVTF